jgi:GxxExxY protein
MRMAGAAIPTPRASGERRGRENGYRVDLLINGLVVVELKSIERIAEVHLKQVLT